ncbi:putative amino acid ABC transporter, periplasmic binding protein [Legionella maceachernii]|uniref:Putative amino acid ABC transporter, periplasmic binding protein n=2 Tax=Legionellaceae TaxID=444 RepID=A0A0W0WFM9_9GAMM|nr:putative amino acid ABC transporter, periplasmic binding protein [Legionella maceachernii]SJZ99407.1 arginine transport system substrate-binding protein [Legionella maceachernii]SUP01253.1 ABC transporter arginine-binding protein 1 precursor [Legionella maceachernii]
MRLMRIACFICGFLFTTFAHAQNELPLKIAVNGFSPPFVMQTGNKQLYGFDISMMNSICKILKRPCQFTAMRFQNLIPSVEAKKFDVAVGSIIITPERSTHVNFSLPYLMSHSRFLGPKNLAGQPFSLQMLNDKTIGVEKGSIFTDQINDMGVRNPNIVSYNHIVDVVDAVNNGDVDIALMDDPTAKYWEIESSGGLVALGQPFIYGFGIGIAVNREQAGLLEQINKALIQYQNSNEFKQNYDRYLKQF